MTQGNEPATRRGFTWLPWVMMLLLTAGAGAIMHWVEGRVWWCDEPEGKGWLWISDVWTSHCSQHLADPYSITHVSHGLIAYAVFWGITRWRGVPMSKERRREWGPWVMLIAVALAAGWEVLENSDFIINRYREETMSLDYMGDSVANAVGDILSCALGYVLAQRLGILFAAGMFIITEVALAIMIRDNLTLNVIMLVSPVERIKAWQVEGHHAEMKLPVIDQ